MSAVEGVEKLGKQLRNLGRLAEGRILRAAARAGIQPALARAKALIPVGVDEHRTYKGRDVRPGFARKSVRAIVAVNRDKTVATAVLGVRAEAFYAVQFVELGTSKTPAQPWLRPAFQSSEQSAISEFSATLRTSITEEARKTR